MNQIEATTIIMNPFPGPEEEMAYCIHCLNPINPAGNLEMEEDATAEYPMRHSESRGWLLYRAMDCKIQEPPGEIIEQKLHTCNQECWDAKKAAPVMENPVLKHQEAILLEGLRRTRGRGCAILPNLLSPHPPGRRAVQRPRIPGRIAPETIPRMVQGDGEHVRAAAVDDVNGRPET